MNGFLSRVTGGEDREVRSKYVIRRNQKYSGSNVRCSRPLWKVVDRTRKATVPWGKHGQVKDLLYSRLLATKFTGPSIRVDGFAL